MAYAATRALMAAFLCLVVMACEGDGGQSKPGDDAETAWPTCETFSKCAETDFVDVISAATPYLITVDDQGYTPKCMRGYPGYVVFFGAVAAHPVTMACGPAQPTPTDVGAGFRFETPGLYGYFCSAHGDAAGNGHIGVIKVDAKAP